jgi:hypothetical protein
MADAKADRILNAGTEISDSPDAVNYTDGLEATEENGVVEVGVKDLGITTEKIAAGAVTYAKRSSVQARTATADGLTTGIIADGTTFVSVTSSSATNAITLPAITAAGIGQTIDIHVGANGYELLTPASSNNTINTVDSDGTAQLDVAANTLLRCVQITATGWAANQIAATTTTVVAPDND